MITDSFAAAFIRCAAKAGSEIHRVQDEIVAPDCKLRPPTTSARQQSPHQLCFATKLHSRRGRVAAFSSTHRLRHPHVARPRLAASNREGLKNDGMIRKPRLKTLLPVLRQGLRRLDSA